MASLLIALKIVPMIFVALFPVVNPIGTALVLYGMTGHVDDKTWRSASRRIALNTFLLLSFFFFFGGFILKLFGISIPVVQLSGGIVVAAIGWGLLNQQEVQEAPVDEKKQQDSTGSLQTRLFYPYTFPITVGPGGLAVVMTFSAHLDRESDLLVTLEQAAAVTGIFAIALVTWFCYVRLKFLTKKISPSGARALSRILAFFVFCIGVQIAWTGWHTLNS